MPFAAMPILLPRLAMPLRATRALIDIMRTPGSAAYVYDFAATLLRLFIDVAGATPPMLTPCC